MDFCGVGEEVAVTLHVVRCQRADRCVHGSCILTHVEHCPVTVKVARERIHGEQGESIVKAIAGAPPEVFKNGTHGNHRGACIPAKTGIFPLAHFAAYGGILLKEDDSAAGGGEMDGGAEATHTAADDDDGIMGMRRIHVFR